jgi:hypothetical protein
MAWSLGRRAALAVTATLYACAPPSGVHLRVQLPPALDAARVASLVVEVQGDFTTRLGPMALGADESLTPDGRLLLTLDHTRYALTSTVDLVLDPATRDAARTSVGACAMSAGAGLLAGGQPADVTFSPDTVNPVVPLMCERADCAIVDPAPFQEVQGGKADDLAAIGMSHFTSLDDTFLVLGAPSHVHTTASTGAVYLVARAPRSCPESTTVADRVIFGRPGDSLGAAAAAGDFDGDGLEDLAVSGVAADGTGVVYVVPNPVLSTGHTIDLADDTQLAKVVRVVGTPGDGLGAQLAFAPLTKSPAGDALVILAPTAAGAPGEGSGLVYVVFGTPANLAARSITASRPLAADGVVVHGVPAGGALDTLTVGDMDGDNVVDLVISLSSVAGGELALLSGKLFSAAGERSLATDAVRITGTGDRQFGDVLRVGALTRPSDGQVWRLAVGSPREGKVVLLAPSSTLWDKFGAPLVASLSYRDPRVAQLTILGRAGFGSALAIGAAAAQPTNSLVVANAEVGVVAALREMPAGDLWDLRTSEALAVGSTAVFARSDVLHWGQSLRIGYTLSDLVIGGGLGGASHGVVAVYAVPSS